MTNKLGLAEQWAIVQLCRSLVIARKRAGYSQQKLAKKLGVARSTVAAWELGPKRGGHGIRVDKLSEVARALGIDVAALLGKA